MDDITAASDTNPFDQIDNNRSAMPESDNPFDTVGPKLGAQSTSFGAFARGAERSAIPAIGSIPAIGVGAELGASLGALGGPLAPATVPIGGIVGGFAGALAGATALSHLQNWALAKLPDSWREVIGMDDRQERIDQGEHPVASFLGGIAPYALTMRPGAAPTTALPENATALQRIMAHPATSRVFGGAAMGGMELGQEAASDEDLDWRKAAIATGFGLVFNRPTRLGEALTELGARPTRNVLGREPVAPAPTVAQAADLKVAGPGVTESVFQGTQDQATSTALTAQDTARTERVLGGEPEPGPDIHDVARRIDPDLINRRDDLIAQRDEFRRWIADYNNPPPEALEELVAQRGELEQRLAEHVASQSGYTGGQEARRLRAQIRSIQAEHDALTERAAKFGAGEAEETADLVAARKHLMSTDYELREIAPQVAAAYRRAAEAIGSDTIPPEARVAEPGAIPAEVSPVPDATTPVQPQAADVFAPPSAPAAKPLAEQRAAIAQDVTAKLIAAGRSPEEAEAAGHLIGARYVARAARMNGALGTAEELYGREGAEIKGPPTPIPAAEPTLSAPVVPGTLGAMTPEELREFVRSGGKVSAGGKVVALGQGAQGKIRLAEGRRPVITLMKNADASTFIHETGHQWLEELLRDAHHEAAPPQLRDDADSVLSWLGAHSAEDVKTKHHEKFARGFEQYMREGVAPSPELAGVFAKFKQWLLQVYETIKGLGKPINDDIRAVFDRMLAEEPHRTVIAADRETVRSLADIHETDASQTEPHEADAAADRISNERDRAVADISPEIAHEVEPAIQQVETERAAGAGTEPAAEAGEGPGGTRQVESDRGRSKPVATGGGMGEKYRPIGGGGGEAASEGSGVSGPSERSGSDAGHPLAPGPASLLRSADSVLVDKAGNIRLDNLTTNEDVARAIREAADANDDFIGDRRGVVTDGQVMELADALGMDFNNLLGRKIGDAFNAEQVIAARKLLIASATHVSEAMKKAATGTDADVMAYALAKDRHQMIQGQVAGITAEAGRALRAFRNIAGQEQAQNIDQFIRGATGKTLFQLRQEAKLGSVLDTPQQVSKFMRDAQKRTFGRMVLEYWINGLISGPATHTTYAVGNLILSLEKAGPETALAAMVGRARSALGREGETVKLGEVGTQLAAGVRSIPSAVLAAGEAFRTGVTTLLPAESPRALPFQPGTDIVQAGKLREDATYRDVMAATFGLVRGLRDGILSGRALLKAGGVEGAPLFGARYSPLGAIPDFEIRGVNLLPLGSTVRAPGRFIAAIHSFFRSMNYSMAKSALAYRMAAEEGLSGAAFDARVGELRQDPTPQMMETARHEATELTLMGKGSAFVQALSRLTNTEILGFPVLKFIDPFVHIAGNIIDQSIVRRTPFGILSPELRADLMGRNGTIAQDTATARMLAGTALAVTFGSLAAEGYASGSGPKDRNESAMWRLTGNQAHSIRVGDIWYDVHRLGPLGMLTGIGADMFEVAHLVEKGEYLEAAAHFHHAITQNILDESFVRGPAELLQAVEDPDRYGAAYIRNFLSSFVPYSVGIAQVNRAIDPYSRQARTVVDAMRAKIPGLSESLLPRRDIWGNEMPNRDVLGAKGLSAIYASHISQDPVNIAMVELGIHPAPVSRKIRNVDLTDEQYDDFARIAGRSTKMRLDAIVRSPDWRTWPPHIKRTVVTEVVNQSREAARGLMFMKYPQIVRDATAAKMKKFQD